MQYIYLYNRGRGNTDDIAIRDTVSDDVIALFAHDYSTRPIRQTDRELDTSASQRHFLLDLARLPFH